MTKRKKLLSLCAVLFLGAGFLAYASKVAHAAASNTYNPRPNDVAIYGGHSKIQAPTSHFLIRASGGANPTARVTLENACVRSTAGGVGLTATVDGQTKSYPGDCNGSNDIVFNGVGNNSVLTVNKINGEGHQPFNVSAVATGTATDVMVTQRGNPNKDTPTYGSDGDNYGVNVWMGGTTTFEMDVPCSNEPINGSDVYFKWKDADIGQYNQPGNMFIYWAITNSDYGNVHARRLIDVRDISKSRVDNTEVSWHLPSDVDVLPGDHIEWQWTNGDPQNAMQHVLPFSEILNQPDCNPPVVQARCSVTASNNNPLVGSNITVRLTVRNSGSGQWPSAVTVTGARSHNPGRLNPGQTQTFTDTFTRGSPGGISYAYHVVDGSVTLATCSTFVNWQPQVQITEASCGVLQISNPGSTTFRLRFVDTAVSPNAEVGLTPAYPAPFSVPPQPSYSYNLFASFPFLVPHHTYYIEAWNNTLTAAYDSLFVNNNRPCMTASCVGSISADTEPGQPFTASYGIRVFNATGRTFDPGTYDAYAVATPGLYLTGASTSTGPLGAGTSTDYVGPWSLRADYGGRLTIYLRYGGSDIGGGVFNGATYPCQQTYQPKTRPTLKVTNGDISTGGGYEYKTTNADGDVIYQCPTLTSAFTNGTKRYISPANGNNNSGGIRTFANPSTLTGSGADFAAYALGYINGASGGPNGFYSAAKTTGSPGYNYLMFANTTGNTNPLLGGLLGGQVAANHCTTDYFDKTRLTDLGAPQVRGNVNVGSFGGSQQVLLAKPGPQPCLRVSGQMNPGVSLTIYTSDDICIDGNITYAPWAIDTVNYVNNAPYLALITTGNIYVQPGVTLISGLFIAQPNDGGGGGVFTSCANGGVLADPAFVSTNCNAPLTVKGSVIAQHVYPVRASGTLFNNTGTSETFDYLPSMAVGQPNLVPICGGAAVKQCEDSVVNLPPVF